MTRSIQRKLDRLKELADRRLPWQERYQILKRMRSWILAAEHVLSGDWAGETQKVTNEEVGRRFDAWFADLLSLQSAADLSVQEQYCLAHALQVTRNLRPHLIHCYDGGGLPRTNNAMEGYIRALKTRYRRMSGRKNWSRYLLRYGRSVAYYESLRASTGTAGSLEAQLTQVSHHQWRSARSLSQTSQQEQRKLWRFRHRRQQYLATLEASWAETAEGSRDEERGESCKSG